MSLKRLIILIIAFAVLISSTSCTNGSKNETTELSISFLDYDGVLRNCVYKFNSNNKNVQINADIYNIKDYDKYVQSIIQGYSSGTVPDIIVFDYGCRDQLDIMEYVNSGILFDMNELIADDKGLNLSDYNEIVLNTGVVDNKWYLIPISYYVKLFLTTEDNIRKNGMEYNGDKWTWDDARELAQNYINGNSGKMFFDFIEFKGFSEGLGHVIMEYNDTGLKLNSDELKQTIEKYSEFTSFCSSLTSEELTSEKKAKMLLNSEIIMSDTSTTLIKDLWEACLSITKDEEPVLFPYPSKDSITAYPVRLAGISASCKNKKASFEFIKMLLDEEVQTNDFMDLPVNNNAWTNRMKTIPENLGDVLNKIVSGIGSARLENIEANTMISEEAGKFAGGEMSIEQTMASITRLIGAMQEETDIQKANGQDADENSEFNAAELNSIEKKELKIYLLDYDKKAMSAVEEYNRGNDKTIIRITSFTDREEYRKKMSTEILSGEGPDIILFNCKDLPTIHKMMDSRVFYNINEYIEKDNDFSISDFNQKVLECGVIDGKRYLVPLEYGLPTLYTTADILKGGNIGLDSSDWTWEGIKNATSGYVDKANDRYLLTDIKFREMLQNSGLRFLDYEKKQVLFNTADFIELLNTYKDIYNNYSMPDEKLERYGQDDISLMKNGKLAMGKDSNILNHENLLFSNSIALNDLGGSLSLYVMPSMNADMAAAAYPLNLVGINSNSSSRDTCYEFIKFLMTGTYQDDCNNIPVNTKVYDEQLERFSGEEGIMEFTLSSEGAIRKIQSVSLPRELVERARELVSQVDQCVLIDEAVYDMVDEELKRFMDDSITAERAARNMNDKITLYLNE